MRPCGHRRRLLRYSAAAASILRSSADIVSGGRLLEPPCVAIQPFFTCFSICHAPTRIQAEDQSLVLNTVTKGAKSIHRSHCGMARA
jgi:hypothetical protein